MTNLDKTMDKNEEEIIVDDTETTENEEQELDTNPEVDTEKEELLKKLRTVEAQKDHWRKKATEGKKDAVVSTTSTLNSKDLLAIMQNNVHEDDLDEVIEYATLKKIPVSEALKTNVVKTILSNNAEFRKTAEVSNTAPARKGVSKTSDDTLLSNLSKGQIPESKEDAERLFWAKRGGKR